MPYDHTLRKLSNHRKAEMIYKQFVNGCNTKAGHKFIIGGCAHGLYGERLVSEEAFNLISRDFPDLIDSTHNCIKHSYSTKNAIVYEHIVPVNVIYGILNAMHNDGTMTLDKVLSVIENVKYAVITKDEDMKLNRAKVRSNMPPGWTFGEDDIFARYNLVGIRLHDW